MTSTQTRIQLALAACDGLSNEELAKRGVGGFKAMINRKRAYAAAARAMHASLETLAPIAKAQAAELAAMKSTLEELDKLDAPIDDVSQAAAMLAGLSKSKE